jgi:hypothetical protein
LLIVAWCHLQNENAWVFCPEESLGASVKAYMDFEKHLKEKLPKDQRLTVCGSS